MSTLDLLYLLLAFFFFFFKGFWSLIDSLTHPLILSALMDFTEFRVSLWGRAGLGL